MSYTYELESHVRSSRRVNVPKFAADLAKALGATIGGMPRSDTPDDNYRVLLINDDLELSIAANGYGSKGKVHIQALPRNIPFNDRPYHDGNGTYKFPGAYVSVSRSLVTIAKDIQRRVIDASAEPLANTRKYVETRQRERSQLVDTLAKLAVAVPEMCERKNGSGNDDSYSRTLDWMDSGVYLTVRVYNTGDVGIDRIGDVPLAAFVEIVDVLRRYAGKKGS